MALRQEPVRLLLADAVGLGKTIEAGLIISELMARGRARRVLVVTPAALREQWEEQLRTLQRAILLGAGRRLGRAIQSLGELPDEYYQVGAVEQYLMSTGRVYFRTLLYADLHRLQFDLETTALSLD